MFKSAIISAALLLTSTTLIAGEQTKENVRLKFQQITNIPTIAVEQSPVDDMWQVVTANAVFYITKDGKHIFSGALHDFQSGLANRSSSRLAEIHQGRIDELKDTFITYTAENEKHHILVFYDSSCGYCKALHKDIDSYLAKGITVSYAAFAALGPRSETGLKHIWCSEDKHEALNRNAHGQSYGSNDSCSNPVDRHNELGQAMGVNGTPAIFKLTGESVSRGYVQAEQMESILNGL